MDVTLRVRYNTAKVCNMTRYYSEMSNRKIIHDILFSDQRHIYIHQSYQEAVDVGNKAISQNNIQEIANIVILQRVLFIKLVSQCKTERNIEIITGNLSVRSRNLQYCAKVMQTIIDKKSVCSDLSRFIADNQRNISWIR